HLLVFGCTPVAEAVRHEQHIPAGRVTREQAVLLECSAKVLRFQCLPLGRRQGGQHLPAVAAAAALDGDPDVVLPPVVLPPSFLVDAGRLLWHGNYSFLQIGCQFPGERGGVSPLLMSSTRGLTLPARQDN